MDDGKRGRGFWFNVMLFFDMFGYGTEWLRKWSLDPLLAFVQWCLFFLRSLLFLKAEQGKKKLQHARKEDIHYCLHDQRLSFFDMFSVVSAIPAYVLSSSDAESSRKDSTELADAGTSKYKKTYSKLSGPSLRHETAFQGKSSELVQGCAFSKDGSRFVICYVSGKVTLWNTDHRAQLHEELLKGSSVDSVSFLGEENSIVLICTRDYTCWKWEIGTNGSTLTKALDKKMISSIDEQIFSQRSDFYMDGTKLVLSTIANNENGSTLDVVLVDLTSNSFELKFSHLSPVKVERDFVISNATLSPDGEGLLVSLMDQAFEDSYCLLWPDLSENRRYFRKLNKATIGSWSSDGKYVVTWTMINKLHSNDEDENSAFIWNVEEMREKLKSFEHSFKDKKITNPFGGNVFWCQVIQDMDEKDRLIMGVIGKTTRFLFIDMASTMHTHTIETGISAKDMILWNGEAWIQSYVAQRTVKGLFPMSVTKDGSMFGAILGWPSEIIIWDAYLGIEVLKVSPANMQANNFKGGIDLMASPSCTKFAIVGSNGVMVFCPSAPSINEKRAKNCLESQMVQLDNPHISQDNLARFKMSFSGDGDTLGVLCIGSSKMQVWNLPQGTSCTIESAHKEEGGNIEDFCLSNNGNYVAIYTKMTVQVWNCTTRKVANVIDMTSSNSEVVEMGINDDASEVVVCMKDGSISWYKLLCENIRPYGETRPSSSSSQRHGCGNLSLVERIKAWFKRPREDVEQELINKMERNGPSLSRETSIDIGEVPRSSIYPAHHLAGESNEATFQVSPDFKEVIRISDPQGVEAWDLETKDKRQNGVRDVANVKRSSYAYSENSSITEPVLEELVSRKDELLNGTSIDLSRRTTLIQSSKENIIVAGNSSLRAISQRRDEETFDFEYNEETQEYSHSIYIINLKGNEYRRRLSGKNLEPRKGISITMSTLHPTSSHLGLAISHDGRHVACLVGDFGSKVVVWNVYASERLLPDYNFLSLTLGHDISRKECIKRDILPLIQEFGTNFFNFRHPSGKSILEETIYYFNNDLLKAILRDVLRKKIKISFLTHKQPKDSTSTSECRNMIEASIIGRSPKTLCVVLKYLLQRVTHEAEVVKILTQSLVCILQHYKAIFTRVVRDPRLLSSGQEIKVLESSLEGQNFKTGTSDSLNISRRETQDFWDNNLEKDNNETRVPLITSSSGTFPYANACCIGVHGLLRDLLINRVHNSAFGSFVIKSLVDYKWKKYAKRFLTQELYHHALVCISFTVYCFVLIYGGSNKINSEDEREENSKTKTFSLLVCSILAAPCLFRELCQCILYTSNHGLPGFVYWLNSAWNWIEVFSYINVVIVIPLCQWVFLKEGSHRAILSAVVGVESLLLWSRMLFYARPFDHTGPLVVTVAAIMHEIFYFLILAISVMFGFALAFCVLYRHMEPMETHAPSTTMPDGDDDAHHDEADEEDFISAHETFGTFRRSFFTVFRYTFGDVEMDVLYNAPEPITALILFVLYVIIIAIILLNVLIALMSERFARIYKNRKSQLIEARARAIDDIDSMLSYRRRMSLREDIGKYLHVITESHRHSRIIKGSLQEQSLPKANEEMTKKIRRDFRRALAKSQKRSDLRSPQGLQRRLTDQHTLRPYRPSVDSIEELGVASPARLQVRVPSPRIMEPDSYWSDSDNTDSDYSDRYSVDSD